MKLIEIDQITKSISPEFVLRNISFSVEEAKVFALLGPNGAGKTTLVKVLLNLLGTDQGKILINGVDNHDKKSRENICFIPEKFSFHPFYTAHGVLSFYGNMKGVPKEALEAQIENALTRLNILDLKKRKLNKMSKGQMQRVGLATMLIGKNDLIILDEPFSGLDPIGMKDLKDIIRELKEMGKTFFINSHILLEMEAICDEVAILNKGELLFKGDIKEIESKNISLENFFYNLVQNGEARA